MSYSILDDLDRQEVDPEFKKELQYYLREYVGRPTPLSIGYKA